MDNPKTAISRRGSWRDAFTPWLLSQLLTASHSQCEVGVKVAAMDTGPPDLTF